MRSTFKKSLFLSLIVTVVMRSDSLSLDYKKFNLMVVECRMMC